MEIPRHSGKSGGFVKYAVIPESPEDLSGIPFPLLRGKVGWGCIYAWIPDNRFAVSGMTDYGNTSSFREVRRTCEVRRHSGRSGGLVRYPLPPP